MAFQVVFDTEIVQVPVDALDEWGCGAGLRSWCTGGPGTVGHLPAPGVLPGVPGGGGSAPEEAAGGPEHTCP